MTDIFSPQKRSWNMSRIKSKDTAPEIRVRSALHRAGYRFRLHVKDLPGKPDIVLPKYKTVIFVHGCFWHRHKGCSNATMPSTNQAFWKEKFKQNVERDKREQAELEKRGWKVIVVWECKINKLFSIKSLLKQLKKNMSLEISKGLSILQTNHQR